MEWGMKKLVLGFISALILVGLVYAVFTFVPQFVSKKRGPLYDEDVKRAQEAVICDAVKHSCNYFDKTQGSGSLKVAIVVAKSPVKRLEVDVAGKPGSPLYYVKLTDNNGVALFNNLPSGDYAIYFNGVNFPKEYGDSPTVPVEIIKNQTIERVIELTPKR